MIRHHLVSIFTLLSLTACQNAVQPVSSVPVQTQPTKDPAMASVITEQMSGQTVRLSLGQAMTVSLLANPTTGYTWQPVPSSQQVVQLGAANYIAQEKTSTPMVGQGGLFVQPLLATHKGRAVLEWNYSRVFEKGVPPVKTFKITLDVQ